MQSTEGVAVVRKGILFGSVREYRCVNTRVIWIKLKVPGERIVVISVYGPGMERGENERESFWECLNECLIDFSENERILVFEDMNAKVRDREIGVVGKHGVPWVK